MSTKPFSPPNKESQIKKKKSEAGFVFVGNSFFLQMWQLVFRRKESKRNRKENLLLGVCWSMMFANLPGGWLRTRPSGGWSEGNCWETSTVDWLIFWCRGSCPKGCLECCCPPLKKNFKENIRQKVQEPENHVIHQFFILVLYLVNLCFNDESTLKLDRFSKKRTFHLHSYGSDDFSNGKLLFTFLLSDSKIAVERATTSSSRIFMIHDFFDRRRNEKRMTTNCWPFA